ncbi:MAG: hydrogenase iron-sulfur subunit [Promethearchaeota archaeon]|nr:MAG: hydrogenase iron-sulfur subunit [Candidatus Lokiarchaeota archaeon]
MLKSTGIDPERLRMEFCSSAEGQRFKEIATEFYNQLKELGGNPVKESSSKN